MPRSLRMRPPFVRVVTAEYPPPVKRSARRLERFCSGVLGSPPMILENGVVRTMDPSLPASRALAIAGAVRRRRRRRARDGAREPGRRRPRRPLRPARLHRLARPLPDLVARAAAGEARRLRVARRGARARPRRRARAAVAGCAATAGATATGVPYVEPTKEALDEVTGETPTIMISKDYHSGWLNSAALAAADGDLEVAGGVVERDEQGRADRASSARSRPGSSATATSLTTEDEWVEATRAGIKLANSRGVAADPRQGRLARRARDLPAPARRGEPHAAGLGLDPARPARHAAALSLRSGFGDEFLRVGYLKCFMDGTLGLADRAADRRHRRRDHERARSSRRSSAAAPSAGWPVGVHAIGDQANRNALDAFEATRDAWQPQGPAAADRARAVPDGGGPPALRRARDRLLGAVLARAVRPRPRRAPLARPARGHLRVPLAARLGRAWS